MKLGPYRVPGVHVGDATECLRELPDGCVHVCITSPPYFGLRDYGEPGQLGLEKTPVEFCAALVAVFHEVRRVLRDDGSLWVVIGDSYAGSRCGEQGESGQRDKRWFTAEGMGNENVSGIRPKELIGVPWMLAFAMRANGWMIREEVIWHKPNPMPESVRDRMTRSHEQVFRFVKRGQYYHDQEAVRETALQPQGEAKLTAQHKRAQLQDTSSSTLGTNQGSAGRNKRSVWTIATEPLRDAHFAAYPRKLVEPMVLCSTSERGVCAVCGAPWVRVVERESAPVEVMTKRSAPTDGLVYSGQRVGGEMCGAGQRLQDWRDAHPPTTTGWRPTCDHDADTVPAVVLDPFFGAGTTGLVAEHLGRRWLGFELNPEYAAIGLRRNAQASLFVEGLT